MIHFLRSNILKKISPKDFLRSNPKISVSSVPSVDKFPVIRAIFVEESRNFANQNPFSAMMHHK